MKSQEEKSEASDVFDERTLLDHTIVTYRGTKPERRDQAMKSINARAKYCPSSKEPGSLCVTTSK